MNTRKILGTFSDFFLPSPFDNSTVEKKYVDDALAPLTKTQQWATRAPPSCPSRPPLDCPSSTHSLPAPRDSANSELSDSDSVKIAYARTLRKRWSKMPRIRFDTLHRESPLWWPSYQDVWVHPRQGFHPNRERVWVSEIMRGARGVQDKHTLSEHFSICFLIVSTSFVKSDMAKGTRR